MSLILLIFLLAINCLGQTVKTEEGYLEFIGLKKWSHTRLIDTLKSIEPNGSLHACAAVLTGRLHFADASVMHYHNNDTIYTVVTVIEPEDSERVKYIKAHGKTMEIPGDWNDILPVVRDVSSLHLGVQFYLNSLSEYDSTLQKLDRFKEYSDIDINTIKKVWAFLSDHRTEKDKEDALRIIRNDGNNQNRLIAVILLLNFSESNESWLQLVEALRDSDQNINITTEAILISFANNFHRKMDWSPAEESLRYLLNGTNVRAFNMLLNLLTKTEISMELGKKLIKDNSELLLAYLKANNKDSKEKARLFLIQISNFNFEKVKDWEDWINNL